MLQDSSVQVQSPESGPDKDGRYLHFRSPVLPYGGSRSSRCRPGVAAGRCCLSRPRIPWFPGLDSDLPTGLSFILSLFMMAVVDRPIVAASSPKQ
jgi:hypothetical protein